jgi:hypothetical protein
MPTKLTPMLQEAMEKYCIGFQLGHDIPPALITALRVAGLHNAVGQMHTFEGDGSRVRLLLDLCREHEVPVDTTRLVLRVGSPPFPFDQWGRWVDPAAGYGVKMDPVVKIVSSS